MVKRAGGDLVDLAVARARRDGTITADEHLALILAWRQLGDHMPASELARALRFLGDTGWMAARPPRGMAW